MAESRNSNNTEHLILEAAEKEFLNKGYESTKTIDIAKSAGVTHAMLHYYFRTKENLFNKVFEEKLQLFSKALFDKNATSDYNVYFGIDKSLKDDERGQAQLKSTLNQSNNRTIEDVFNSLNSDLSNEEYEIKKKEFDFLLNIAIMMYRHFNFIAENPLIPRFVVNELISRQDRLKMFSISLKKIAGGMMDSFEKDLNYLMSKGVIKNTNSFDLLIDIASLNVFVFITFPIIKLFTSEKEALLEDFFKRRKVENLKTILHRLTNDEKMINDILSIVNKEQNKVTLKEEC